MIYGLLAFIFLTVFWILLGANHCLQENWKLDRESMLHGFLWFGLLSAGIFYALNVIASITMFFYGIAELVINLGVNGLSHGILRITPHPNLEGTYFLTNILYFIFMFLWSGGCWCLGYTCVPLLERKVEIKTPRLLSFDWQWYYLKLKIAIIHFIHPKAFLEDEKTLNGIISRLTLLEMAYDAAIYENKKLQREIEKIKKTLGLDGKRRISITHEKIKVKGIQWKHRRKKTNKQLINI